MTTSKSPIRKHHSLMDLTTFDGSPEGFRVVKEVTVGSVRFDGTEDPMRVAFDIIGLYESDHQEGGTYRWPSQDGGTVEVSIEYREDN